MLACKISHLPGIVHLPKFESSNCFVRTLKARQTNWSLVDTEGAEKSQVNSLAERKTLCPLRNKDNIFL